MKPTSTPSFFPSKMEFPGLVAGLQSCVLLGFSPDVFPQPKSSANLSCLLRQQMDESWPL